MNNEDLGASLTRWDLLTERNRKDSRIIEQYEKWSFTVSFLQLINSWQWFFSGILLGRKACLPAQSLQLYYYSIFFSYGAYLSAQFKGGYTLKSEAEKKSSKQVWLDRDVNNEKNIAIGNDTGDHKTRANWFYEVFRNWEFKDSYPDVALFCEDRRFHSDLRNMYTYSLSDMAEELYGLPEQKSAPSNETLICLWMREIDYVDVYPEEFWALEHIRVVVDLHTKLLEKFEGDSPYGRQQILLLKNLCNHHSKTGLTEILQKVMPVILQRIE